MRNLMKRFAALFCVAVLFCATAMPAAAANVTAKPTTQKLYLMKEDGTTQEVVKELPIYNINYNNYMKIRDIGYLLDFQVEYNSEWKAVSIITAQHSDGVQVSTGKATSQQSAAPAWSKLYIDGKEVSGLTMYNIAGNNYIKIRDIANAVGFGCCYSGESKAIVLSPFYGYSSNDVMTDGGRRTVAYADGQGNLSFSRSGLFAAASTTPTTPASTGTIYKAGDTLVLKRGGSYTVNIGVGEKVYIDNQLSAVENWTAWDGNKFVDGKRVAEISWDSSKNMMAINGQAVSTVTIQCLSIRDIETVLATIDVTVTASPSNGSTGSGTGSGSSTSDDYMDIREEIVRLTNEVRKENGVGTLPTDDALMEAAQMVAEEYARTGSYYNGHDMKMEADMRRAAGITYGGGSNLTGVYGEGTQAAQDAVDNWVGSSGHLRTMLSTRDNIGVGVAKTSSGALVCIQLFGLKSSALGTYS